MAYSRSKKNLGIISIYFGLTLLLEKIMGPLLFFIIRLWIAQIFWHSGLSKIQSWSTTLMLFKNEYKAPFFSPDIAAKLVAGTELSCPILLAIGFAARLATIPMLIMTGFIELTYLHSHEHLYWALLLGLILCYGPEQISLDFFIRKWFFPKDKWRLY